MSRVEVDYEKLQIPRLTKLQKEIVQASNTDPDETIITLDNGAMVALRQRAGRFTLKKIWDVHAMNGVTQYRDFQIPATKDIDADIQALAYEMARQQMEPMDIVVAITTAENGQDKHIAHFDIQPEEGEALAGRPVTYTRVRTVESAPATPAAE